MAGKAHGDASIIIASYCHHQRPQNKKKDKKQSASQKFWKFVLIASINAQQSLREAAEPWLVSSMVLHCCILAEPCHALSWSWSWSWRYVLMRCFHKKWHLLLSVLISNHGVDNL
jgi:hypothetical protein